MLHRKSFRPFLICSLIIHVITVLIMMKIWYEPYQMPSVDEGIMIDITHLPRPEVRRREPEKPPPAPPAVKPTKSVEKITPPKPKPAFDSDWLPIDAFTTNQRATITATVESSANHPKTLLTSLPRLSTTARPKSQTVAITTANLPKANSEAVLLLPQNEHISVGKVEGDLAANSPNIGSTELRFWHRRGGALRGMSVGNASGGSIAAVPAQGNYVQMMTDLARGVADAATAYEVDLVFIIDKTGSMEDNVRGIRAYVDFFFEHLARAGHDTAVGLVTFSDVTEEKPKARGVTTDSGKFKNWLYKIDFEGGGDLAESGLDALMAAVHEIKFRRGAQRFFVFASDGAFHDADYDGRSEYSLDQVIETLQRERIRVDVIGLDYLPIKQIAWGTEATWRAIPGKGYLEYVPPITLTAKMLSEFGVLGSNGDSLADELVVYVNRNPRPKWLNVSWKVLNPLGEKCYGPFADRVAILDDGPEVVRFSPPIDVSQLPAMEGTYTVIYRLENDLGHRSILRRTFDVP